MICSGKDILFPSPCGVTVIKSGLVLIVYVFIVGFPSPCGVTVIKSSKGNKVANQFEFPSPYGVTVIKSRHKKQQ